MKNFKYQIFAFVIIYGLLIFVPAAVEAQTSNPFLTATQPSPTSQNDKDTTESELAAVCIRPTWWSRICTDEHHGLIFCYLTTNGWQCGSYYGN